jgi:hypothetical protein
MLHDVVVVGAGPVGPTLALRRRRLRRNGSDARPAGTRLAARSLALSHGRPHPGEDRRRDALSVIPGARTPITRIDIS